MAALDWRLGGLGVLLLASLAVVTGGCNTLFGVDELRVDVGSGGSSVSSAAMNGSGGFGGAAGGSDAGGGEGGGAGGSNAPTQTYQVLGTGSATDMTPEVSLTFQIDAPAGAMLIAILVGRGTTPTTIADNHNNVWMQAVEESTDSAFGVVAIYYTLLDQPQDEITINANFNIGTSLSRSLVLLQADATELLATGKLQSNGANIEVTTDGTIDSDSVMRVSAVVSGFGSHQGYTPAGRDEQLFLYAGFLSSGAVFGLPAASLPPGPVTFMVTADQSVAGAAVTAVFE